MMVSMRGMMMASMRGKMKGMMMASTMASTVRKVTGRNEHHRVQLVSKTVPMMEHSKEAKMALH